MNDKVSLPAMISRRAFSGVLLAVFLLSLPATTLRADDSYLRAGHPDGLSLLAPPPIPGSEEEAADLSTVRSVFKGRTPAEEARAKKDEGLSFSIFAPAIGPAFQLDKLPHADMLLKKVKAEIGETINVPKRHWHRTRPYVMDTQLAFGKPEESFSYPSGHSSRGTVYALVLAELFPEKREAILAVGRNIGWDRVLIGKHFPTDVQAGRVLGQAIVQEMLASPAFQHDLAEARAEIQAAQLQPAGR